jgi:hypothetical protein
MTIMDRQSNILYPFTFSEQSEAALVAAEKNIHLRRTGQDGERYVVYKAYQLLAPRILYAVAKESSAQRLAGVGFEMAEGER